MGYANKNAVHRTVVSGNKDTKVINQLIVWNNLVDVIIQDQTTTVDTWVGLSYSDANSLFEASETSNGRPYLGSAVLTFAPETGGGGWIRSPACWGTKTTTQIQRIGDTNLYSVTKTTTVYDVRKGTTSTDTTLTKE